MSDAVTVGEAADRLAKATGADADTLARRIRTWLQQGVFEPSERFQRGTTGRIAAAGLDERDIAIVRLLFVLDDIGLDANRLGQVNDALRKGVHHYFKDGETPLSFRVGRQVVSGPVIDNCRRAAAIGEKCQLAIRFEQESDGRTSIAVHPIWLDFPEDETTSDAVELVRQFGLAGFKSEKPVLSTLVLDLKEILGPLSEGN